MSSTLTSDLPATGFWGGTWAAAKKNASRFLIGLSTLLIAKNVYDEAKLLNQADRDGNLAPRSPSPCDDPEVVQSMAMAGTACVDPDLTMGVLEGVRRVTVAPILEATSRAANYAHFPKVADALRRGAKAELPVPNTYEGRAGTIAGEGLGAIGTFAFGEGEAKVAVTVVSGSNDLNGAFDIVEYLRGTKGVTSGETSPQKPTLLGKQGQPGDPHYLAIYRSDQCGYSIETANPHDAKATAQIGGLSERQFQEVRDAAKQHKGELRQAIVDAHGNVHSFMVSVDRMLQAPSPTSASPGGPTPQSTPHGPNTAPLRAFTVPSSPAATVPTVQATGAAAPRSLSNPIPGHH